MYRPTAAAVSVVGARLVRGSASSLARGGGGGEGRPWRVACGALRRAALLSARGSCADVSGRVAGGGSARQSGTRARTSIVRVWSAAFGWPLCPMDYGAHRLGLRRT